MTLPAHEQTIPLMLEHGAGRYGDAPLVRGFGRELSYLDVRSAAAARAGALREAGVRPGDRVAAMSENRIELLELWLGCAWAGAVFVPLNTALRGRQLAHQLENSAPAVVYREEAFAELVGGLPLEDLAPGEEVPAAAVRPDDPAAILYTSGTTGPSKGVVCPQAQWYWWGVLTAGALGIREGDVLYTNLPLFHTNAMNAFCQALVSGATYALGPRFSASAFWERVTEAEATVTYLLGAMVSILHRQAEGPFDRRHSVRIALAPATPAELHGPFAERFGVRLIDAWGSTETNIVLSNTHDDIRPGTIGRVLAPFEAEVADNGELRVRTPEPLAFASGYFGMPEATATAWRDGWFYTGDRVAVDEGGSFRYVDRLKDAIRRRGENISSYEVEEALLAHPEVAAAAVVGVPSDLGEEDVLAFVLARDGGHVDPLDLVRSCESRLAYFAIPRYVEIVPELPLTPSGKIEKYRLRERGVGSATWDAEAAGYRPPR